MKELELKVEGMVCGGCEKRVENSLSTLEGVSEVIANHQKDIDIEVLKEKIEDLGFEVK